MCRLFAAASKRCSSELRVARFEKTARDLREVRRKERHTAGLKLGNGPPPRGERPSTFLSIEARHFDLQCFCSCDEVVLDALKDPVLHDVSLRRDRRGVDQLDPRDAGLPAKFAQRGLFGRLSMLDRTTGWHPNNCPSDANRLKQQEATTRANEQYACSGSIDHLTHHVPRLRRQLRSLISWFDRRHAISAPRSALTTTSERASQCRIQDGFLSLAKRQY